MSDQKAKKDQKNQDTKNKSGLACPECGETVVLQGRCATCPNCFWSLCST